MSSISTKLGPSITITLRWCKPLSHHTVRLVPQCCNLNYCANSSNLLVVWPVAVKKTLLSRCAQHFGSIFHISHPHILRPSHLQNISTSASVSFRKCNLSIPKSMNSSYYSINHIINLINPCSNNLIKKIRLKRNWKSHKKNTEPNWIITQKGNLWKFNCFHMKRKFSNGWQAGWIAM